MDNMTPISSGKDRNFDSTSVSYQPGYQPPIVLVKKIPHTKNDRDLQQAFQNFGQIKEISILQPKLYAYVEFYVTTCYPESGRCSTLCRLPQQISFDASRTASRSLSDQCRQE
jgi:hypothetical protein